MKEFIELLNEFFKYIDDENRIISGRMRSIEEETGATGAKWGALNREKSLEEFVIWYRKYKEGV